MVYIHSEILLSHEKNETFLFVTTWMDLEGIMLSDISKTKKHKYYMISLICGIKKMQQYNQTKRSFISGVAVEGTREIGKGD